ncbi:MAG: hypothetical protein HY094_04340 [Candidatus Melainabacteria bacterium]|nr:hypothetical protein [Candidatus Melainabacteria bacterium]
MKNKDAKNNYFDEDYLTRCLSMTPEKRLEKLEELRDFFWCSLPEETKKIFFDLNNKKL